MAMPSLPLGKAIIKGNGAFAYPGGTPGEAFPLGVTYRTWIRLLENQMVEVIGPRAIQPGREAFRDLPAQREYDVVPVRLAQGMRVFKPGTGKDADGINPIPQPVTAEDARRTYWIPLRNPITKQDQVVAAPPTVPKPLPPAPRPQPQAESGGGWIVLAFGGLAVTLGSALTALAARKR